MRKKIIFLFIFLSATAWADTIEESDLQIHHLEKALIRVQQEAQSTYQQFLMIQELRRNEIEEPELPIPTPPVISMTGSPVPKYEDMVKRQEEKQKRIEQYSKDLDGLYTRYKELEDERIMLIEQINQLEKKPEE